MTHVHVATGNPHKLEEIREALGEGYEIDQIAFDQPEIDAPDVAAVARRKVRDALEDRAVDGLVIADDTGLYVDALDGFPGSHASFFLDRCGNAGLLKLMEDVEDRSATFRTAMAVRDEHGEVHVFEGECEGTITHEERGDGGFGYDTVFVPDGHDRTFAEDEEHKADVSHRKRALDAVVEWVRDR